jgi:hypothetical protein
MMENFLVACATYNLRKGRGHTERVLPPKKWTQVRQLFVYPKCCSNSTGDW